MIDKDLEFQMQKAFGDNASKILSKEVEKILRKHKNKKSFSTSIPLRQDHVDFLETYSSLLGCRKSQIVIELIENADLPRSERQGQPIREYSLKQKHYILGISCNLEIRHKLQDLSYEYNQSQSLIVERLIDQKIESLSEREREEVQAMISRRKRYEANSLDSDGLGSQRAKYYSDNPSSLQRTR